MVISRRPGQRRAPSPRSTLVDDVNTNPSSINTQASYSYELGITRVRGGNGPSDSTDTRNIDHVNWSSDAQFILN